MHTAGPMLPISQTITADDTNLDMKDEGHGFYPLMGYFCHVRSRDLLVWMLALFRGCLQGGISIVTLKLESGREGYVLLKCFS